MAAYVPPAPRRLPPQQLPVIDAPRALRALLHTRLVVDLADGRQLSGHLLAVDDGASLLLSSVRERRVLPDTPAGRNAATYYPFSADMAEEDEDEFGAGANEAGGRGCVRVRELASVLVPMKHVVRVAIAESDAAAWGRYAGVEFREGAAVPPPKEKSS